MIALCILFSLFVVLGVLAVWTDHIFTGLFCLGMLWVFIYAADKWSSKNQVKTKS